MTTGSTERLEGAIKAVSLLVQQKVSNKKIKQKFINIYFLVTVQF